MTGAGAPAAAEAGMCGSVALAPSRISTWCGGTEPLATAAAPNRAAMGPAWADAPGP